MSEVGEGGKTGILQRAIGLLTEHFGVNPDKLPARLPIEEIDEGAVAFYIKRDIGDAFAKKWGGNEYHRSITSSSLLQNMGYHLPFGGTDLFQRFPVECQRVNIILQELTRQNVLDLVVLESSSFYSVVDPKGIEEKATQWINSRKLTTAQKV